MEQSNPWPRCPQASAFFDRQLRSFLAANPPMEAMASRFLSGAGARLHNLVDHWVFPETPGLPEEMAACGLAETENAEGDRYWHHPEARLPRARIKSKLTHPRLALGVEDVEHFAQANGLTLESCHGDPDARYQCGHIALPQGELMPIARRGYAGFAPGTLTEAERAAIAKTRDAFLNRNREGDEIAVTERAQQLAQGAIEEIGIGRATEEFFAAERAYYMARNRAARWQFGQQQALGFGWANHDHHTYRSSRAGFRALMQLWRVFGFLFRERFYAGMEAGWGAQVLEHPECRIVLFADVDIAPEELNVDFADTDLPPRDTLGTIGLWCALHASSIARAGLHHLEAEYDFAKAQAGLKAAGFGVMAPFTDLPVLKQAFTEAETWPVAPERIQELRDQNLITPEQADRFLANGAAGSHLEILQRWEGFKGFNKTGVSDIIRQTDARRLERK